jgi:glycine/D-amino acid oxidase-like deaminating enzyme
VAVIGAGYTGLSAALTLSRAGKQVHVFEAEHPGYGASTRNSGYVGFQLRSKLIPLIETLGRQRAMALAHEAIAAHRHVISLIEREQIACRFHYCGRFIPAHNQKTYDSLAREADLMTRELGVAAEGVPRARQREEIGSDFFCGGLKTEMSGALHPGLFLDGLLDRALAAGAVVHARTPVASIVRERAGRFRVETARGAVVAGHVLLATNGYTGAGTPWHFKRIIRVNAGVSISERLPPERIKSVLPTGRTTIDTRYNPLSFRVHPDGDRIQFSAARGLFSQDHRQKAREMHAAFVQVFPHMADMKVARCWTGQMGFTFDELPHIGDHGGVLYAMGYCGSGVAMAPYLGHKMALRALGAPDAATAFDDTPLPLRWYYRGHAWFLPAYVRLNNFRDARDVMRARRAG